ncbi:MAG: ribonuclease J [Prevotella sp.]|nr:ribonuclease J [Staphylococcus sp.]MCM1349813.1 ribonuclease J [Prevotella sp.]
MAKINIFALGGLGENGKNMYVVEVNEHIFILDAGLKYPDIDMYGVDAVIPDISYLIENKDRIEGIFISHGHEDHINALPYLLKQIPTRVYGTHFTICLIENLLSGNKMNIKNYKLFRVNENKILTFGKVTVSLFNTTHSIPESVAISIATEDGSIVYCTDFNFGPIPFGKYQTSFDKITEIAKRPVLALMSESIGAGTVNRIKNDSLLEHTYKNILVNAEGRIIVSAYSSDLSRIQKIINMSVERGKQIAIVGRVAEKIIDVAIKSHYLDIPKEALVTLQPYQEIDESQNRNDLVVIVAGVRNEPYTLLMRMAMGEDKLVNIGPKDTAVIMCPPIPGTEKASIDALNMLYRYDVNVHILGKDVLRSAHADKEDLKLLYAMLKPKYILPVKGEYRHMYEQSIVASDAGWDKDHILLLDNGEVAEFENGKLTNRFSIPSGDLFVDGSLMGSVDEQVIKNREALAEEGAIILTINYDIRQRKVISCADIVTKGLSTKLNINELSQQLNTLATRMMNNQLIKKNFSLENAEKTINEEVQKLVFRLIKKRPVILTMLIEISK